MDIGKIKYPFIGKQWQCALRNYKSNKFNRLKVLGHVNSRRPDNKHNGNEFDGKMPKNEQKHKNAMAKLTQSKNC